MKLGPFEIGRSRARDTVEAATAPPQPPTTHSRGASGTVNQAGFLQPDEYSNDLRFPLSLRAYERMRRSDSSVREALQHIFAPILNAAWTVEPASDDPLDLEVAEFVRRAYFDWPVEPFEQTMRQTLLHLTFGFQFFELVEQVVEADLEWDDPTSGDKATAARRQFVVWRRWAHRKPATVFRWIVTDGELEAIQQRVFKDGSYAEPTIDAADLVVFVNEKEGDDFTGISLLRTAYKSWWLKEVIEKVMGIAIERHGVGILTAYIPEDSKRDTELIERIEDILKGLHAGEFPYVVWPGPKQTVGRDTGGNGGFFFEIVSPSGGIPDFTGPLEYLRGEIKGNVLARFAELGHGSTGARATGDTQSQVWYAALHAVASYVQSVHRAPIKRLVDKNYTVDRYPELVARDIEARNLTEYADANAKLVSSGAINPDRSYREAVRKGMDLPDEDEEDEALPPGELEPDPTAPPRPPVPPKPAPAAPGGGGA